MAGAAGGPSVGPWGASGSMAGQGQVRQAPAGGLGINPNSPIGLAPWDFGHPPASGQPGGSPPPSPGTGGTTTTGGPPGGTGSNPAPTPPGTPTGGGHGPVNFGSAAGGSVTGPLGAGPTSGLLSMLSGQKPGGPGDVTVHPPSAPVNPTGGNNPMAGNNTTPTGGYAGSGIQGGNDPQGTTGMYYSPQANGWLANGNNQGPNPAAYSNTAAPNPNMNYVNGNGTPFTMGTINTPYGPVNVANPGVANTGVASQGANPANSPGHLTPQQIANGAVWAGPAAGQVPYGQSPPTQTAKSSVPLHQFTPTPTQQNNNPFGHIAQPGQNASFASFFGHPRGIV